MKVSARNVFEGVVQRITPGTINDEVTLQLGDASGADGDTLVAVLTDGGVKSLGLAVGKPVIALVKAPWVFVAVDGQGHTLSARNQLRGTVISVTAGSVNSEVGIRLPGGTVVHAVITHDAVRQLGLAPGKPATAIIKASDVILAIRN